MLPLLSFHALVAHRGDGLRRSCSPCFNVMPNLRCFPRTPVNNLRRSRRAKDLSSPSTRLQPNDVGPPKWAMSLDDAVLGRDSLRDHAEPPASILTRPDRSMPALRDPYRFIAIYAGSTSARWEWSLKAQEIQHVSP